MAKISMNKAIHAAVRRDLQRFLSALEAFPEGDRKRAGQLARAWTNFDDQLTDHHESEHEIVWPAVAAVGASPQLIDTMDAEHQLVADALSATSTAMAQLKSSASTADAEAAKAAMTRLQEVAVAHFDHEETEMEPISSAHRDAPEIHEIAKKFGRRLTPAKGGRFIAWVLDDASPEARDAVTREIPGPVVKIVGGIFGRPYRRRIASIW